jgi:hypothetical protein
MPGDFVCGIRPRGHEAFQSVMPIRIGITVSFIVAHTQI